MKKYHLLVTLFSLGLASGVAFAGQRVPAENERQDLLAKMDRDFFEKKMSHPSRIISSIILNQYTTRGERGEPFGVLINQVRKIEYTSPYDTDITCAAYAISELSEGYLSRSDYMTHVLSDIDCN